VSLLASSEDVSSRIATLMVAGLLLQGCPALIEDDYRAVDQLRGEAGSSGLPGAGGSSTGTGGTAGAAVSAGVGGAAGTPGSGATGGDVVVGLGGSGTGGLPGTGGILGVGGATGGSVGIGGATGGSVGTGGATGGSSGSGGATGGSAGADGGTAGEAGATAGSAGAPGGAAGTAGSAGAPGGAAGAAGSAGNAGNGGSGGTGGSGGAEPFCPTSPTDCLALRNALIHRYRFEGTGTAVTDSVGDADGTVMGGATLGGDGELTLAGGSSGQYVNLPNQLISVLDAATLETWVIWEGGTAWQRVFDFGDAMADFCYENGPSATEGQPGECGRTFLMLTPRNEDSGNGVVHVSFMRQPGTTPDDDLEIRGSAATVGSVMHLAVVVDEDGDSIDVYVDGELEGSEPFSDALSDLNDINNWLGRSQFLGDASRGFRGTYLEFRIYDAALSESELATSFTEGPDPAFLD